MLAGPNGAGKTSFGDNYLSGDGSFEFVNADEMARGEDAKGIQARSDVFAARMMLRRMDELVDAKADFMVETTLATLAYAQKIPEWRMNGYVVTLVYLRLSTVEDAIKRVRKRVAAGGHGIPEDAIRRRFVKSLQYLETIYKPIVDEWYIWESREGTFVFLESRSEGRYGPGT